MLENVTSILCQSQKSEYLIECDSFAVASAKTLRNLAIEDLKKCEPAIVAQIASQTGKILKLDHTFWGAKFVGGGSEKYFTSILTVMNERSQLIGMFFCTSKSLLEVKDELRRIALR